RAAGQPAAGLHRPAEYLNAAVIGAVGDRQPGQVADEGGFAGAGGADQGDHLAGANDHVDIVERPLAAPESLAEAANFESVQSGFSWPRDTARRADQMLCPLWGLVLSAR